MNNYISAILFKRVRCATASVLFFLLLGFLCISCFAGTSAEIASLLEFVERSECVFIRNGNQYDSLTARQHIEKKYNYYKERISNAEDFIFLSATKSSITGKPYTVLCDGRAMNSSEWLNAELKKMRTR